MASHQVTRDKKTVKIVEKDRVPKMASHFENLTVSPAKDSGDQSGGGLKAEHGGGNVGKFEMEGKETKKTQEMEGGAAVTAAATDISPYRQAAQQNSIETLRAAEERYNKAKEVAAEKAAQAKDLLIQGAQKTPQVAGTLKDTALEKGQPLYEATRDTLAGTGKTAANVVAETTKGPAGYVGSVATTVKDKAVVVGWGAAEYTAEKVVGATKAAANVTSGAAGYVGETAVGAKNYAAQKLGAAKDAVVATEESAKDYAARKRAEAERNMQAKRSAEAKGEVWSSPTEEKHDDIAGAGWETFEKGEEYYQEQPEYGREGRQQGGGGTTVAQEGGGVFNAIGETIVEIGQTTKDLLVGKGPTQATETMKDSAEHDK